MNLLAVVVDGAEVLRDFTDFAVEDLVVSRDSDSEVHKVLGGSHHLTVVLVVELIEKMVHLVSANLGAICWRLTVLLLLIAPGLLLGRRLLLLVVLRLWVPRHGRVGCNHRQKLVHHHD